MKRLVAFPILLSMAFLIASVAAQELPQTDDSFEVEPPLLIPNQPDQSLPVPDGTATSTPRPDIEQLEKDLERAKKSAASAAHLYRIGVLAKVDEEKRALRVVRLQVDLARARLTEAKENVASQESRVQTGEISKADLAKTQAALGEIIAAAETAAADLVRAELEAAALNLRRQQKLLALGSGRRSDVARAEEKLAALKRDPPH